MVCLSFLAGARSIVFVVIACLHFHCLSLIHLNFFHFAVFITLTVLFGLFQSSFSIHLVRVGSSTFLVFRIWVCTWTLATARFAVTIRHIRCIQATSSGLEAISAGWLLFAAEIIAKGLICLSKTVFYIARHWRWRFDLDGLGDKAKNGGRKDLKFHFY